MLIILQGKTYSLPHRQTSEEVCQLFQSLRLPIDCFTFRSNGNILHSFEGLDPSAIVRASIPLLGGKGGYGAKLKTEGGKKVRPNENMFSRDMSGQKIVNIALEKEYREHVVKKIEQDKEVAMEREQFKVMESTIKEGQSFMKLDKAYKRQIEETEKNLASSIMIGKQKYLQKMKKKQQNEQKVEIKEPNSQEEKKVEQAKCKRATPCQRQGDDSQLLEKKVKVDPIPVVVLPKRLSSAEQRFKALFKKK